MRRPTDAGPTDERPRAHRRPQDEHLRECFLDIAAGGERADSGFTQLYGCSRAWLVLFLRRCGHDAHSAHELVHEVYLRVLQARNTLPAVRRPSSWLLRTAYNAGVDRHRKVRGPGDTVDLDDIPDSAREELLEKWANDARDADRWREEMPTVERALAILRKRSPDGYHALGCAANGLSGQEMAEELGRSPAAAKQLLSQARKDLEKLHALLDRPPRPRTGRPK